MLSIKVCALSGEVRQRDSARRFARPAFRGLPLARPSARQWFRSAILGPASAAAAAGRASAAHDRRRKAIDNAAKALVLVLHLISNTQNLSLRQQIGTKKTYIERKIRKLLVDDVGVDLPIEIHRNQVENVQRHHIYCFDYFPNRLCRC